MPLDKIGKWVGEKLVQLKEKGILKGKELVITEIKKSQGTKSPRYLIEGEGKKEFIKMNSNSYLGMSLKKEVIEAEKEAAEEFGVGPGAVRFIYGTFKPHLELEKKLARFHQKEAGMLFSSAYAAVCGILSPLISSETIVISDTLNHNSIINAIKLSKPKDKKIYIHLNMDDLETKIKECRGNCRRVIIVTDGVFSMRGDHSDFKELVNLAKKYHPEFKEGVFTIADDSHGVGAFGKTGRGTSEVSGENDVDILVSTLGKALGVNGGYVVTNAKIVEYLRETAPFYIYSNPITPPEANAALKALEILNSQKGRKMLSYLKEMTIYFKKGLTDLGYETIKGEHPIVAVMIRDTQKTIKLVNYLKEKGILAVGLKYPIVPQGDECIRFQISADHTKDDLDDVLKTLREYKNK
ncbi:MAG: 7-keto-8-aminopelargonate synthetase [bacterium (Candidatus Ratteibacteria) CG_4_10_14_3_um_filter_41_18]|uniref:7-keto-8-aminopelargonate synthetase n=4 Tax=Candidatus Ratteibacteria TaxID=2979319 RepID=A0A2M7YDY8_9BACT|nr:MAG: 7-keto-8-aminopelargonate synthetase [Candidatus Omnitrophica bacterium CG1_02_41_171]PIV63939.1 MAG: 7-keto-8-aminopelargonate synthetase [bacterium (Candidatus Ratteibacteria) CG01_land_8_20_14_3_00_40_19]PIW34121.1 MAG: 7-keto-8-aminopelargonate synthetase [bacterium (Candidatus Ratteibacteria) CG15_BIG_FIL_POST_REV_8_21_14_020_41_12]PIX76742.1 MAG: 7-keto-8-aminopelargonate synthetase [bacterium (Candidatus Ratteibacteria) CG_4_10_14_3_um_filter_41_18]PJA61149.1 MAG: 7-keto-8-aminop